MKLKLIEKFRKRTARIAVVGLGRVGLPTSAVFADAGYHVIGVDVRNDVVQAVSLGKICTKEHGLEELLKKVVNSGTLKASTDTAHAVRESDAMLVCVQTPLDGQRKPDLAFLEKACKDIARGLSRGKLVIIESTVPPRTMKNVALKTLEKNSGLKCGVDFWLAYCPERITSGRILQEFASGDRIVGGFDEDSAGVAAELLKTITAGDLTLTDCRSAEVAKLAENTFRDVNIAFANELALLCEQVGVDVKEVIRLANTHARVKIHSPGCGVGGPCLTKDPYLLLSSRGSEDVELKIIETSRKMNDSMPNHTVTLVVEGLREAGKDAKNSRVAILGVAYKGETDDASNSPAEQIVGELMNLSAEVVVYDPFCEESFGAKRVQDLWEAVSGVDCLVFATDHKVFQKLSLQKVNALMNKHPVIVDGKRLFKPSKAKGNGFIYRGIGYGI